MKYRQPEVEEDQDTDDLTNAPKRKRGLEETPTAQEQGEGEADSQPPTKAAKSAETPGTDDFGLDIDDSFLDDDGEFDLEDLDDDLSEEEEDEEEEEKEEEEGTEGVEEEPQNVQKEDEKKDAKLRSSSSPVGQKVQKTIEKYGRGPLEGTAIEEKALTGSPDTILAMLIEAMLKSRPISHNISDRAVHKLIDVGYHDIQKLGGASWEERAMALQDGGYNRYREQGSTNLGALVGLVNEKYDGDLNNLIKKANYDRQKTRQLVKEVKGLGDLGVELFFNNVQSVWPSVAPFIDSRSLQTAKEAGFGTDVDAIYADLEQDSVRMCKFANALSAARLDKRVGDLVAI